MYPLPVLSANLLVVFLERKRAQKRLQDNAYHFHVDPKGMRTIFIGSFHIFVNYSLSQNVQIIIQCFETESTHLSRACLAAKIDTKTPSPGLSGLLHKKSNSIGRRARTNVAIGDALLEHRAPNHVPLLRACIVDVVVVGVRQLVCNRTLVCGRQALSEYGFV